MIRHSNGARRDESKRMRILYNPTYHLICRGILAPNEGMFPTVHEPIRSVLAEAPPTRCSYETAPSGRGEVKRRPINGLRRAGQPYRLFSQHSARTKLRSEVTRRMAR